MATIVAAAIELADADGLAAVSMRRVAERLGKSAMALYTYVPGKAELLDLMLDTVYGELPPPTRSTTAGGPPSRPRRAPRGRSTRAIRGCCRSPARERCSAPASSTCYEAQLRLFDGLGLPAVEVMRAVGVVAGFVRGAAKAVSDARTAEQATGVSDDDWWNARSPFLDELSADVWATRYPTIAKLSEEHAFDQLDRPDDETPYMVQDAFDTFEFGLQRLLDGFEAYIGARQR